MYHFQVVGLNDGQVNSDTNKSIHERLKTDVESVFNRRRQADYQHYSGQQTVELDMKAKLKGFLEKNDTAVQDLKLLKDGINMLFDPRENWTSTPAAKAQLAAVAAAVGYTFEMQGQVSRAAEAEWLRWVLLRQQPDRRRW